MFRLAQLLGETSNFVFSLTGCLFSCFTITKLLRSDRTGDRMRYISSLTTELPKYVAHFKMKSKYRYMKWKPKVLIYFQETDTIMNCFDLHNYWERLNKQLQNSQDKEIGFHTGDEKWVHFKVQKIIAISSPWWINAWIIYKAEAFFKRRWYTAWKMSLNSGNKVKHSTDSRIKKKITNIEYVFRKYWI